MSVRACLCLSLALLASAGASVADEPAAPTVMTERGKLLFGDAFDRPLAPDWRAAKGKWEVKDGAVTGSEVQADMHAAVIRRSLPFRDAVIAYAFKFEGSPRTTLSINTARAHLCRVIITPTALTVQKDDSDKAGPDKAVVFETRQLPIKAGEWHTLVVELRGQELLACLDGQHFAFGGHAALDVDKANVGLTVGGGGAVSFKQLRVWEATPNKAWEVTRAKLLGQRPQPPAK